MKEALKISLCNTFPLSQNEKEQIHTWIEELETENEQLHSVIKEAREIVLNYGETFDLKVHQDMQKKLLDILDKE